MFDPSQPFTVLDDNDAPAFDPSQPFEEVAPAPRRPGLLRRIADATGMMGGAEYRRRLAAGEIPDSGLSRRISQFGAGVIQGSPSMIGEAVSSPEVQEVVQPMAARLGPPLMASLATGPGAPLTATGLLGVAAAGAVGDTMAQVIENRQGTRQGYSPREAAGAAAASPLMLTPIPARASMARAVGQGALEGAGMAATSALVGGRDLSAEEFLTAGLMGAGFRGVTNAAARDALRAQLAEQASRLGYDGPGTMRDMREWYRSQVAARARPPEAPPAAARPVEIAPAAAPAAPVPAPAAPAPAPAPVAPIPAPAAPAVAAATARQVATATRAQRLGEMGRYSDEQLARMQATAAATRPTFDPTQPFEEVPPGEVAPATGEAGVTPPPPGEAPSGSGPAVARPGGEEIAPSPAKGKGKKLSVGLAPDGTPDLLTLIEDLGGVPPPPRKGTPEYDGYNEAFGVGAARLLRARSGQGAGGVDTFVETLAQDGYRFNSVDEFYAAVRRASEKRQQMAKALGEQRYGEKFDAALFENTSRKNTLIAPEPVPVDTLQIGDKFKVRGEPVQVVEIDDDLSVTVKDGVTRRIPPGTPIYPDRGVVDRAPVEEGPGFDDLAREVTEEAAAAAPVAARAFDPTQPFEEVTPAAPRAPAVVDRSGQLGLIDEGEMGFNLASEVQSAPAAPAPRASETPAMFAASEVASTAPTRLDQANAAAREVSEETLQEIGLIREFRGRWQWTTQPGRNWKTTNSKESAVEQGRIYYAALPKAERITAAERSARADVEYDKTLEATYGKATEAELREMVERMNGELTSLRNAARREFNGNGGRRTGAAVAAEGAREIGEQKMRLEGYIQRKFGESARQRMPAGMADAALPVAPTPRPRRDRAAEREARLPPYNAGAPLLYRADPRSPYVQVPLARLPGIPNVEMPEIVRLVQTLTGERPQIKRLARALGLFRPRGVGQIELDPRIFRDSVAAAKTLAHEVGHLIDYLPHATNERGNILGHLASARNHLLSTLPDRPRNPNTALTSKERAALYRAAEQKTRAELGPRPKADGDDADPQAHGAWGERRSEIYRDSIEAEIATRKLLRADEVRAELIELTELWKPYQVAAAEGKLPPSYVRYRESSKELYADALSVLFNSPATLRDVAPLFYDAFFAYLRNKPEVFRAILATYELLGTGQKRVLDLRDENLRAAARNGAEILRRKAAEREARTRTGWRGWVDGLRAEIEDIHHPLLKREAAARKAGKTVPLDQSPSVLFEEMALADNAPYRYLQRLHTNVVAPLQQAGVSLEDYGLFLFYNRILNERLPMTPEGFGGGRSMMANPQGITPEAARLGLLNWRLNHGLGTFQLMQRADAGMRALVDEVNRDAVAAGVFSQKTYDELIAPNRDQYAAFAVLDYLSDNVPAGIQVGQGTFKDVANAFTATTLKMLNLRRWIQRNESLQFTTQWMRRFAPDEIAPAATRWDGKKHVPQPPPRDSELEMLEVFEDGKRVGYYVPPDVARMFADMSPGRMAAVIKPFNWFFREGVYPLWITFNPYFQLFSGPARDVRRSFRNMPGREGLEVAGDFLANYGTLAREGGAAVAEALGRIPGMGALGAATARRLRGAGSSRESVAAVRDYLEGAPNPLISEMMEAGAIGTPLDNFRRDFVNTDDAIQRRMEALKLLPPSEARRDFASLLRKVLGPVEYAGLTFEMLAKTSAYQIRREAGASPREAANFVRNYVGVPNFRKQGRYTREVGSLLPFFNVFVRGFASDAQLALQGPRTRSSGSTSNPRPPGAGSRTGWWMRYFAESGLWAVLKAMGKIGLLGAGVKTLYDRVSDYDMTNFTVVPLGEAEGGEIDGKKTSYLRLPEDETSRLLSGFLYKTILSAAGQPTNGANLASIGAGQLPSINPIISLGEAWTAWASGYNPRDGLRNSPVLTNDVWLEGGWPALRDMTLYTAQETGAMNFFRYDPRANTTLEISLNAVPGLGRVLKVSDYGLLEAQEAGETEERQEGAILRNSLPDDVAKLRRSYYWLARLGRDGRSEEQERRFLELQLWHNAIYRPAEQAARDNGQERLTRDEAVRLRRDSEPFLTFEP